MFQTNIRELFVQSTALPQKRLYRRFGCGTSKKACREPAAGFFGGMGLPPGFCCWGFHPQTRPLFFLQRKKRGKRSAARGFPLDPFRPACWRKRLGGATYCHSPNAVGRTWGVFDYNRSCIHTWPFYKEHSPAWGQCRPKEGAAFPLCGFLDCGL